MAYTEEQKKLHIQELQRYLYVISCYDTRINPMIPNGVYDSKTIQAVKSFQKIYGLTETGEVNETTWKKIVTVYKSLVDTAPKPLNAFKDKNTVVRSGDNCFTVIIIQAILFSVSKQYTNVPDVQVTGEYDIQTEQAVQIFQKMCALPVTGNVDCETWNILAQIGCDL
ncbi:MAG: peptidoglycan-binding protein [Oscillospiraceae bacterium]|nr:peptidoglycan-binding protein [Oscillospiraceae bacterium]MDE7093845.1 peptidoglycan-binding protein [Oscillospiraceae bacterium]